MYCTSNFTGVRGRVPFCNGRLLPPHFPKEATTITGRRKPLSQVTSHHREHQLKVVDSLPLASVDFPIAAYTSQMPEFLSRCHSRSRYLRRRPSGSPRPAVRFHSSPLHILRCRIRLSCKFCLGFRSYPQLSSDPVQSPARCGWSEMKCDIRHTHTLPHNGYGAATPGRAGLAGSPSAICYGKFPCSHATQAMVTN